MTKVNISCAFTRESSVRWSATSNKRANEPGLPGRKSWAISQIIVKAMLVSEFREHFATGISKGKRISFWIPKQQAAISRIATIILVPLLLILARLCAAAVLYAEDVKSASAHLADQSFALLDQLSKQGG